MQVFEILDVLSVDYCNKIILRDLDTDACEEIVVETTNRGSFKQPVKYNKFAHRNVFSIHVIGKTIDIMMLK